MHVAPETIRITGPCHGLRELPGERLILHAGRSLVAVAWSDLRRAPEGSVVEPGSPGYGRVIATNVAVDNAWSIQPGSGRVLVARQGQFQSIDGLGSGAEQLIRIPGLPTGTFAAEFDPSGRYALLTIMRPLGPDFAEYGVALADLTAGQLTTESGIGSTAELELLCLGGPPNPTWVVGDTSNGALWRWDGHDAATPFQGPIADVINSVTFEQEGSRVIATALIMPNRGAVAIQSGRMETNEMKWSAPVPLPGRPVTLARRHPLRPEWACLAGYRAEQEIQIRSARELIVAASPSSITPIEHLRWSAFSPDRLWAWGHRSVSRIALEP